MAACTTSKRAVLFVCFGNTCRSTMAEAILRHLVAARDESDKWVIDSAGISDYNVGLPPNPRTMSTLKKYGIPTGDYFHTARLLTMEDYNKFDVIFGMDPYNLMALKEYQPSKCWARLQLLGDWDPQGDRIIYDPLFTSGTDAFETVFQQCMRSLTAFVNSPQT